MNSTPVRDVDVELDAGILAVTIARPTVMNAVTAQTLNEVADTFEQYARDPAVHVVVLSGTEGAFCSGADLSTLNDLTAPPDPATIDAANRAVAAIRHFPRPVIGAVGGPAVGVGVSLALACDLTVASESAYFMLAFTKIGLMPDGGATALVSASIGRARAMRMALLAERVTARHAVDIGLIASAHPDSTFAMDIRELAARVAAGPRYAFQQTKHAVNAASLTELERAFTRERMGQLELLGSVDFVEGVRAFRAKQIPAFGRR
ncbi:enoyl-CoA hydratase-related protein [Prescottella subtropica]|uniref:enoyl-CoA hydratase-related protein n=1 Tax=Prescottella subtropica TaxID=2545757 RepID=UPI0010F9DE25|nr:enoyl-CoA hydratase-related protein [Prescottella subtropica]